MEDNTRKLLEECNSGCKMAIESMDQVGPYVTDEKLKGTIQDYNTKHKELEKESSRLLAQEGESGKEPGMFASAFSWMTTEVKMMARDDNKQAAKIMMNGCNMGIQSITETMHECKEASRESVSLAKKLVRTEDAFMQEMKNFL